MISPTDYRKIEARDLEVNQIIFVLSSMYQVDDVVDLPVGKVMVRAHKLGSPKSKHNRDAMFTYWEDDEIFVKGVQNPA